MRGGSSRKIRASILHLSHRDQQREYPGVKAVKETAGDIPPGDIPRPGSDFTCRSPRGVGCWGAWCPPPGPASLAAAFRGGCSLLGLGSSTAFPLRKQRGNSAFTKVQILLILLWFRKKTTNGERPRKINSRTRVCCSGRNGPMENSFAAQLFKNLLWAQV